MTNCSPVVGVIRSIKPDSCARLSSSNVDLDIVDNLSPSFSKVHYTQHFQDMNI